MKKDVLARGASSAVFAGGFGETDVTRNLYKGEDTEEPVTVTEPELKKALKVFIPLASVVLVRRAVAEDLSKIIITETIEKDKPAEGTVLATGPDVKSVAVGDYIVFGKYAGAEFPLNGETLLLMEVREVLGIIQEQTQGEN